MHLFLDTKIKTNLSVITLTVTIVATPLIFVIGPAVVKRDNFLLVLERERKQKEVPPILDKMYSEKHYLQA